MIGIIITFRKGVKEESVLFITKFEPQWLEDNAFSNYINSFAGKSSKSSRLVITHSSAKAWGEKKVNEAIIKLKEIEAVTKLANLPNSSHTINFTGPSNNEIVTTQPSKNNNSQAIASKTTKIPINFTQEFERLTKQFQQQMEQASLAYQAELAKLTMAVAQSS